MRLFEDFFKHCATLTIATHPETSGARSLIDATSAGTFCPEKTLIFALIRQGYTIGGNLRGVAGAVFPIGSRTSIIVKANNSKKAQNWNGKIIMIIFLREL